MVGSRPRGVTVLGILFIIFAVLGSIAGIAIILYSTAWQSTAYSDFFYWYILFTEFSLPSPLNAFVFMRLFELPNTLYLSGLMSYSGVEVLGFSVICLIASIGLLSMKKWGRNLALIAGIIGVILGVLVLIFGLSASPGWATPLTQIILYTILLAVPLLIFGIATLWYLTTDVKKEFQ